MIPLSAVDIDTSIAATAQEYLAWIIFAAFAIGVVVAKLKLRYMSLETSNRRHLESIRSTLTRSSWHRVPIAGREDRGPRLQRVNRAIRGDLETSRSARAALGTVRGAIADRLPSAPPLAIRASVEGVLIVAFSLLLAVSVDRWEAVLFGSLSGTSVSPGAVVDGLAWVVETTLPGGPALVAFVASVVLLAYSAVLLEYGIVLGIVLVALSLAVVELDRRTPTNLSVTLYPDRRRLAMRAGMWVGVVWLVAAVGGLVDPALGGVAGVLATLTVAVVVGKGLLERLYAVANLAPPWAGETADLPARSADVDETPGGDYTTLAYVIVRQTVGVVALIALPVLAYSAAMAVSSGAAFGPLVALLGGPTWAVLLVVLAAVVVAVWALSSLESLSPLRRWLRRRVATGTIRSAVVVRGVPVAAAAVGGLVGWAYLGTEMASGPWYVALASILAISLVTAAVAVAFVLTGRYLWDRVGVWMLVSDSEPVPPTDQVVEVLATPLEDGAGEPLYVARVDGRPLAARSPERLFRCVEYIVDERFATGETPTLLEHELYRAAVDRGVVDRDVVAREVHGDVETRITATLADKGGEVDRQTLEDELAGEYPDPMVDDVLTWLKRRGKIGVRDGKYVLKTRGVGR